jgi:hypothetical protein
MLSGQSVDTLSFDGRKVREEPGKRPRRERTSGTPAAGGSPSLLSFGLNDFESLKVTKARSQIYETNGLRAPAPSLSAFRQALEGKFHWERPIEL